ncbi:MAG: hypothetical protein ACREPJ_04925 [Rhodanobacteraceae bacterium]
MTASRGVELEDTGIELGPDLTVSRRVRCRLLGLEDYPSTRQRSPSIELESTRIKVNAAPPGFVATALNNFKDTRTVEQAARETVRLALFGAGGPTGAFSGRLSARLVMQPS